MFKEYFYVVSGCSLLYIVVKSIVMQHFLLDNTVLNAHFKLKCYEVLNKLGGMKSTIFHCQMF